MKTKDFYFELPESLIAQYPLANRSDSRLLAYSRHTDRPSHHQFKDLADLLQPGDLLVMNNSKVIPARFYGKKSTGGHIEILIERLLDNNCFLAHIRASKAPKAGTRLYLEQGWEVEVITKENDLYHCQVVGDLDLMLEKIGHMPLPLYISRNRTDDASDWQRFQTVYAQHKGSVAVPAAGLHFDDRLLQVLKAKGIQLAYLTLHIGAGTFRPVRSEQIKEHKMHVEQFSINEDLCQAIKQTRATGQRVIAVGTTSLRALESAAMHGELQPCQRDTDIFIYPGYQFQICDGLITNFHLPESTLLMLVAAFVGHAKVMALYEEAISHGYRFYSYGDACLFI